MVDSTIALQVRPPEVSDLSTTLLRAYQIKNAQQQNELQPLRMQQMQQQTALGGVQLQNAQERQGALSDYSMRKKAGDPRAQEALAAQPDLMHQVFQNMDSERQQRIQAIGDSAKAVYPLRGTPQFKEAWQREMDNLQKKGVIDDMTYKQWRDNPSDLALNQALSMGAGLETYLKTEGQAMANSVMNSIAPLLGGSGAEPAVPGAPSAGGPSAAIPKVDQYAANVIVGESGGRNLPQPTQAPGQPLNTSASIMQFKKGTWDDIMRQHPDLGLTAADRFKPEKQIIAEPRFRRDNAEILADGDIVPTDRNLYMAHFLGGAGAKRFLTGMAENPDQPAINLVDSGAASANRSVFYSPGGQPLSARQVYEKQTARFGNGMAGINGIATQRTPGGGLELTVNDRLASAAPTLATIALLPNLPEETRKTVLELAKAGITAGQPTNTEKDYQSYSRAERVAGRAPLDRLPWEIAQKKAGATQVNIDAAGGKEVAQGLAKRYLAAEDSARAAAGQIRDYETLDKLLADPNVYTGTGGETVASLKKLGTTLLGLDLKGVPNAEVASKITDKLALTFRQKGEGSTSNMERELYRRMSTGLSDSAGGRTLMTQLAVSDARYLQQQAEIWRAHLRTDGSVDPTVYKALSEHDTARRTELSDFLDKANEVAGSTTQPSPMAGSPNVVQQLREKYKGLEP
ncbi:MAG: hypothetical protein Q7S17_10075 [Xanthobacteraceae bacterium]|nr:hypothetical protein [Xanthobacteraceae bacterium]